MLPRELRGIMECYRSYRTSWVYMLPRELRGIMECYRSYRSSLGVYASQGVKRDYGVLQVL
jgi:hypothetical protein